MKDSGIEWIGKIPEHWDIKKIKHFTKRITKGTTPTTLSKEFVDKGILFLRVENITENQTIDIDNCLYIDHETNQLLNRSRLNKGNVLITIAGAIGRAVVVSEEKLPANINQAIAVLDLKSDIVEPQWISNNVIANYVQQIFTGLTVRTAQSNLSLEDIGNTNILLPPLQEQKVISAYLDKETAKIDSQISRNRRLVELLKEKRQATINHAVTKGLDPTVPMKDSGIEWIGKIPENWKLLKFRHICRLRQGLQIPQDERYHEPNHHRLPYITIQAINAGDNYHAQEYIENPSARVVCNSDDVLLARTGATGEVVTDKRGVFHNNFFAIDYDRKQVMRDFLVFYLKNSRLKENILLLAGTTTIPDLNHDDFLGLAVILPSIAQQQQISKFLNKQIQKANSLISKTELQIEKLQEYRQLLISAAVTGKMDVRQEIVA